MGVTGERKFDCQRRRRRRPLSPVTGQVRPRILLTARCPTTYYVGRHLVGPSRGFCVGKSIVWANVKSLLEKVSLCILWEIQAFDRVEW